MPDDESTPPRPSALARARRVAGRGTSATGPRPSPRPTSRRRGPQPGVTFGPATDTGPLPVADVGGASATAAAAEPATAATPATPATKSRAGRNLPAAIGVGVGLGALIVASLFLYRPSF